MHFVTVDRRNALVSLRLDGFFGLDEVEVAARDLHAAIRSLGAMAGRHRTLYDMIGVEVAPGPVIEKFGRYFTDPQFATIWARKVAFVSSSALFKGQLRRARGEHAHIRIFDTRALALGWLLAD